MGGGRWEWVNPRFHLAQRVFEKYRSNPPNSLKKGAKIRPVKVPLQGCASLSGNPNSARIRCLVVFLFGGNPANKNAAF